MDEDVLQKLLLKWCKDINKTLDETPKDHTCGAKVGHEGILPIIRIIFKTIKSAKEILTYKISVDH